MKNICILLAAVLGMVISATPEDRPQRMELSVWKIYVQNDSGEPLSRYSAELYDSVRRKFGTAELGFDGAFEFERVPTGDYTVVVKDSHGVSVHQEFVSAKPDERASIRLPKREAPPQPEGPVSVAELRHPPPRKAVTAVLAGQKLEQAGQFDQAARQFQKAIDISAEFALAYSDLAASHLRTGNFREAASEASRAIELSRPNPVDLANLALAQDRLGQIAESTATARQWLGIAPDDPKAHWLLGLLLARDKRTLAEAAPHLERAAQELPEARPNWEALRRLMAEQARANP
ncbi:MAG: tetratricopeptide repeat protein [Bryobacteraceae bacterium]